MWMQPTPTCEGLKQGSMLVESAACAVMELVRCNKETVEASP